MKRRPQDMALFDLDYGEMLRPPYQILRGRGWGQCTNRTNEYLVIYGPKHEKEPSIFDTSPYILPPGSTTPDNWDCDGFFVPADRLVGRKLGRTRRGPLAVKFWNYRRFSVVSSGPGLYCCSWDNGVFEPSLINWAIPNLSYAEVAERVRRIPAL